MVCYIKSEDKSNNNLKKVAKKSNKSSKDNVTSFLVKEKKRFMVEQEFSALKSLLPASDDASSPLDVVLEAISYIQKLEQQLSEQDPDCSKANLIKMQFLSKQQQQ